MHTYNTAPPSDKLARAQNELNQVKDIMVQNVEQILSRGEQIGSLVSKTDVMAGQATAFRRGARAVRHKMWWKDKKVLALSILIGLVRNMYFSMTRISDEKDEPFPFSSSYIC
jgi:vesicle-associated membrane protein 7